MKSKQSQYLQTLKERQNKFNVDWKSYEKKPSYNALQDKHAGYYFGSNPVKKHLKKLKKIIITELTTIKPKDQDLAHIINWTPNKNQELANKNQKQKRIFSSFNKIKTYQQSLHPSSLQKLKRTKALLLTIQQKKSQTIQRSLFTRQSKISEGKASIKQKSKSLINNTNFMMDKIRTRNSQSNYNTLISQKYQKTYQKPNKQIKQISKEEFDRVLLKKKLQLMQRTTKMKINSKPSLNQSNYTEFSQFYQSKREHAYKLKQQSTLSQIQKNESTIGYNQKKQPILSQKQNKQQIISQNQKQKKQQIISQNQKQKKQQRVSDKNNQSQKSSVNTLRRRRPNRPFINTQDDKRFDF